MNPKFLSALESLQKVGWIVHLRTEPCLLPPHLKLRYPWVSDELEAFLGSILIIQRHDEKVWLLAATDYAEGEDSVFAWNEWELQSLEAAMGDLSWSSEVKQYWNSCLPIALSVADGYAYFGLRSDGTVVFGREPEYEDAQVFAATLPEFLDRIGLTAV